MDTRSTVGVEVCLSGLPIRLALLADERLARLVQSDSERAFATIYERYHQPLYRYSYSILHDRDDARDALQSTLACAFAALRRGQRDSPLRPWLFRIAHNEAISLVRRRGGDQELTETLEHCMASAEDRASERARLASLLADLRELPERQRGALVMRELSGLSHKEIAIALGISTHAVKRGIHEAHRSLVEFREGRVMLCPEVQRTISYGDSRALRHRRLRAHLRGCTACEGYAAANAARGADLQALFPPLPPVLAAGLLARLLGTGSGQGVGGAAGVAGGVAGKTFGATFAAKALVVVTIVAATGAGVTGALAIARQSAPPSPPARAPRVTPHMSHAGRAARPDKRALGAHSWRGHHDPPAHVLGGKPTGSIGSVQVPSSDIAPAVPDGSGAAPGGGGARELRSALGDGAATRKGAGSRLGGGTSASGHEGGAGGRSGVRAQHPGAPSGASGVAGNRGGQDREASVGVIPGGPGGMPSVGGRPSGQAGSAPETKWPPTAEGVNGRPSNTESGVGAPPNAAPSPTAPNALISPTVTPAEAGSRG
jgi:RNA polymerase sigma factor (sigma-70 family)